MLYTLKTLSTQPGCPTAPFVTYRDVVKPLVTPTRTPQIFFGLKMTERKPLSSPTTVKVPPMSAQMEVTNSYQCFPFFVMDTDIGDKS